jgi:hypothetical protein
MRVHVKLVMIRIAKFATSENLITHSTIFPHSSSFLGSTAQLKPWPPAQNLAEFLGGLQPS